jgi:hypothetical protein
MSKHEDKPTEWTLEQGSVPNIARDTHEIAADSRQKVRTLEELRHSEHEAMADELQRAIG